MVWLKTTSKWTGHTLTSLTSLSNANSANNHTNQKKKGKQIIGLISSLPNSTSQIPIEYLHTFVSFLWKPLSSTGSSQVIHPSLPPWKCQLIPIQRGSVYECDELCTPNTQSFLITPFHFFPCATPIQFWFFFKKKFLFLNDYSAQ